jgi:hypothetical protein
MQWLELVETVVISRKVRGNLIGSIHVAWEAVFLMAARPEAVDTPVRPAALVRNGRQRQT